MQGVVNQIAWKECIAAEAKRMTLWCTAEMATQVVTAIHCVRQRLWRQQPNLVWLDVSQAEDVLRACLEYLCGDTVNETAITHLVVPSHLDVQHTARL